MKNIANKVAYETIPCRRCNGTGHVAQYATVLGGRCFDCGREGRVFTRAGKRAALAVRDYLKGHPSRMEAMRRGCPLTWVKMSMIVRDVDGAATFSGPVFDKAEAA